MKVRKISSADKMTDPMLISEVPKKFCQETSLHGWKYLNSETKITLKFMWFVVLLSACIASFYFMFYYTAQFMAATTVTTIDSTIAPITVMSNIINIQGNTECFTDLGKLNFPMEVWF